MRFSLQLSRSFVAMTTTFLCGLSVSCLPLDGRPCAGDADCVEGWRCAAQTCQRMEDVESCSSESDCAANETCVNEICEAEVDGGDPGVDVDPNDGGTPPQDGGTADMTTVVRNFDFANVEVVSIDIYNDYGLVSVTSGDSATLKVVATISLPTSKLSDVDDIVEVDAELSITGLGGATIHVYFQDDAGFDQSTVDLAIEIPSTWDLDVFGGRVVVEGIHGDLDLDSEDDVVVTDGQGDIDVYAEGNVDVQTTLNEDANIHCSVGDIVLRVPLNAAFDLTGEYLPASGSDLGPFTLVGSDTFGTITGIIGNLVDALDHDVSLFAYEGSITLRGF